ncbi:MAG: YciI family protein [Candidatus Sumerlaeia bacterium]|nr:YciI family protein [Candidatus Sumerlaeia bacterium]
MKVMVMVKATPGSEANVMPSEELMQEMGKYNEELVAAKIMKGGEGLKPTSEAVRIRFSGKNRTVINGPFAETKELVAGYWIWEVKSMEEAIEWVKKCPNPMMDEESDIDIRPVFGMEDFAEWDPSGEFVEQEKQLLGKLAVQSADVRPYLFFGGRCEEALEFYKQALGAEVGLMMRFNQSPEPMPEGMLPPGFENKIMHAEFQLGALKVMVSDGCGPGEKISGFSLALTVKEVPEAEQLFNILAKEGTVQMPMSPTFWSPSYGQVTDKFGVAWMVMAAGPES